MNLFAKHIDHLLTITNIPYTFVEDLFQSRFSFHPQRRIWIPRIDGDLSDMGYAVCLHELGHANDPTYFDQLGALLVNYDTIRTAEVTAWEWAQANALAWTAPMEKLKRMALHTYGVAYVEIGEAPEDFVRVQLARWVDRRTV